MYSPILIGSANTLFRWFKEWVYQWLKRQTKLDDIKKKLYNGLGTEIDAYLKCFDDSEILFNEKIIPLVESIEIAPNNNQINQFLTIYSEIISLQSNTIDSFVNLACRFNDVTINKGFMQDLNEASRFMYDFVLQMSHMVQDNKTVIMDDPWWTYLRMNKEAFNKMFTDKDTKLAMESYLPYVRKIKNVIVPALSKRRIRKKTSQKITKSRRHLINSSKYLIVRPPSDNTMNYLPSNLQSISLLLDELEAIEH